MSGIIPSTPSFGSTGGAMNDRGITGDNVRDVPGVFYPVYIVDLPMKSNPGTAILVLVNHSGYSCYGGIRGSVQALLEVLVLPVLWIISGTLVT